MTITGISSRFSKAYAIERANPQTMRCFALSKAGSVSAFTLDTYGHVTARMKQASAERMERFIKANSG